jgi:vesicle coat complex subunit
MRRSPVDWWQQWESVQSEFRLSDTCRGDADGRLVARWGQTYILESLMYYVPEEQEDAELLAERISIRLQHSNSAVVLTTVKVILYLMNYMGSQEVVESMCRKLSPPLGESSSIVRVMLCL